MKNSQMNKKNYINNNTSVEHSNYNIVKIGHNTEKSPSKLRRLAVI